MPWTPSIPRNGTTSTSCSSLRCSSPPMGRYRSAGHWQIVLHLRTKTGVFVEERVQPPLALVQLAGKVLVPNGNVNAVPEILRLQERQQGVKLVPVARDLTVGRQEV